MLQMFLLYIMITVQGQAKEFRHPILFERVEACASVMVRLQQVFRDNTLLDVGCRSVLVAPDGHVQE